MASLDVSSLLGMLSGDGVSALGKSADTKKSQVSSVLDSALPLLLTGMKNNASTKAGASSLNKALKDHAKNDTSDIGSFLQNVDLSDGGKILTHILGDSKESEAASIAEKSGISSDQVMTILSAVAPLLLSKLGSSKAEDEEEDDDGAGLGDLLGSLLSGSEPTAKKKRSKKKKSTASALGGLLGGLLGGSSDEKEGEGSLDLGGLASLAMNVFGDSEALEDDKPKKKSSTKKTSTKKASTKKSSTKTSSSKSSTKSSTTKSGKKVVRVGK